MAALDRLDDLEAFVLGLHPRRCSGRAGCGSSPVGCTTTRFRRRSPSGWTRLKVWGPGSQRRRSRPDLPGEEPWPEERKRALIERGYRLTDDALAANTEFGDTMETSA